MNFKNWTQHHFHRGYHALTFATSVILVAFFAWVLGIALASVNAQPAPTAEQEQTVSLTPTSDSLGRSESGNSLPAQDLGTKDPSITAVPGESIQQRYVLRDGKVQPVFIFRNQFPKFIGLTNIEGSTAVLDIFGPSHVTGKAPVDSNGNWVWEPTIPIKPGTYQFNVKVIKGQSSTVLAKDSMLFEIVLTKDEEVIETDFKNTPQLGNQGTLFDVRAIIPESSKRIESGTDFSADIKFINFGSPGKAVDVEVRYTISNEQEELIAQTSETVAVSNELTFSKTFSTSSSLPTGTYTLTVAVPSEDLIATSTDTVFLTAKGDNQAVASGTKPVNRTPLILEIIGGMLFLGVIVAYMEYNKVIVFSHHIKQLSEKDLLKPAHHKA